MYKRISVKEVLDAEDKFNYYAVVDGTHLDKKNQCASPLILVTALRMGSHPIYDVEGGSFLLHSSIQLFSHAYVNGFLTGVYGEDKTVFRSYKRKYWVDFDKYKEEYNEGYEDGKAVRKETLSY